MAALTLAIVGETLFSSNVQGDADEVRDALTAPCRVSDTRSFPASSIRDGCRCRCSLEVRKARAAGRVIHRVIPTAANESDDSPHDLMRCCWRPAIRRIRRPGMSDQQIRDEAMTIFLAGHETTANAMAWTWHLLGCHAAGHEELPRRIRRVLGDRLPTVDDVTKLEFTRMIIAESMRLYPPAWTMGRRAIEPHRSAVTTSRRRRS